MLHRFPFLAPPLCGERSRCKRSEAAFASRVRGSNGHELRAWLPLTLDGGSLTRSTISALSPQGGGERERARIFEW